MFRSLILILLLFSCTGKTELFSGYNIFSDEVKIVKLNKKLKEISGLTFSDDNRLFCHNDEKGEIFEIDFDGNILKSFYLKDKPKEDFEDIAYLNKQFFLVTSAGEIYQFPEGDDREEVEFRVYKTELKAKFDVEGLCVAHNSEALLLACKEYPGKGLKGNRAIYSFNLSNRELDEKPEILISKAEIENYGFKNFNPSAIEYNSKTKSYFLIDGKKSLIMEMDLMGNVMNLSDLNYERHKQPEGLTFYKDGSMIISDEAVSGKAQITFYQFENN